MTTSPGDHQPAGTYPACLLYRWNAARPSLSDLIAHDFPDWSKGHSIYNSDLGTYR